VTIYPSAVPSNPAFEIALQQPSPSMVAGRISAALDAGVRRIARDTDAESGPESDTDGESR
jgi:hypothetical protein